MSKENEIKDHGNEGFEPVEKKPFNQESINAKIKEVKELPEPKRLVISNAVKRDLRGWLLHNFIFTKAHEERMAMWPRSLREETGFGIGTALLYQEWTLEIVFPDNSEPTGKATKHEQEVKGDYNPATGSYTVSKKHTWSW